MAEVMDTRNITRAGEIKVWVIGSNIPRDDEKRWIIANYASPFYGTTPYNANTGEDFSQAPTSFGAWFPMPFVGNKVFIFYPSITGENVNAFWFSCPINPMMNSMLPGIPSYYFKEEKTPFTEMNDKKDKNPSAERGATLETRESGRVEYTPLKNALEKQGLKDDEIRGYSTAGSKREAPSMCYGFLTPFGNSFTMDDGWNDEDNRQTWEMGEDNLELKDGSGNLPTKNLEAKRNNAGFRLRTRNGTQLWIGDEGNIYAINAEGTAWCEISEDGRLHGYAKESVDIASDGDINLKSKKKIRMEADEGFVFKTGGDVSFETSGNFNLKTPKLLMNGELNVPTVKATSAVIDDITSKSANLTGTFSGTLDGTAFYATSAGEDPSPQPKPKNDSADLEEPETVEPESIETTKGTNVDSVLTAMPAKEPYSKHANNKEGYEKPNLDTNTEPVNDKPAPQQSPTISNQVGSVCPTPPDYNADPRIPKENISPNFELSQLCYSETAMKQNISNIPGNAEKANLAALSQNILEPVRQHFGQNVIINSGYRSNLLNSVIGGVANSQHTTGEAADIEVPGVSNYELACWIRDNLPFDQIILEFANNLNDDPNSGWVHVSYSSKQLRGQCLTINNRGTMNGFVK